MKNQSKILALFFFIITWQALSIMANSELFPSVVDIIKNFYFHLFENDMLHHLFITLYRVFLAFFITMAIGIFFGLLMGFYEDLNEMLDFILLLGLNIPALVTIIVCYIWFGLTDFAAILAVVINKVPVIIINIRQGTKDMDKKYDDFARVYKLSKQEIYKNIYLPQLFPYLMATIRLSLSLIWKIVLVVELLGRSDGVGFQIAQYFQFFDITSILSYTIAFVTVVLLIESFILKPLEAKSKRWK